MSIKTKIVGGLLAAGAVIGLLIGLLVTPFLGPIVALVIGVVVIGAVVLGVALLKRKVERRLGFAGRVAKRIL